jgi:hypothetical protein
MALNFLGLGFSFGAKDLGLEKLQTGFVKGFKGIAKAVLDMNDNLQQNKLQTFIQSVSLAKLNKISDSMRAVVKDGLNLTTSLEHEMATMGKEAKAAAVNMGMMGKDATRFQGRVAGMAKGLNIAVSEAADATWVWGRSMKDLQAAGINSAEDLAKLTAVTGANSKEFGDSLRKMRIQLKMSDKDMSKVVSSFTAMGQAGGNVGEALGEIPGMMDLLSRHSVSMGKAMNPAMLADFASQTASVSAGLMKMGHSQAEAKAISMKLAETLVGEQENMQNMFSGTSEDLGDFTKELAITRGDVTSSFKLMQSGPAGLVKGIATMVMSAKKSGKDVSASMGFLAGRLRGVLGEQVTADLVNMFKNADDAMLKTMVETGKAEKDLGKLAKAGFSTGRTLSEEYELAKEAATASFRSMGHAREAFVRDSSKQFAQFTKALRNTKGPLRAVVEKMADMHAIGALALIPEALRPMAAAFEHIAGEAVPVLGALGAMGFRMKHLVSPAGLATIAVAGLGTMFIDGYVKGLKLEAQLKKNAKKMAEFKKAGKATDAVGIAFDDMADKIEKALSSLAKVDWTGIWTKVLKMASKAIDKLKPPIQNMVKGFWAGVTGAFDPNSGVGKTSAGKVGGAIGEALREAVAFVSNYFKSTILPAVAKLVAGIFDGLINGADPSSPKGKDASNSVGVAIGSAVREGLQFAGSMLIKSVEDWWHQFTDTWSDSSLTFSEKVKEVFGNTAALIIGAYTINKFVPVFSVLFKLERSIWALSKVLAPCGGAIIGFAGKLIAALVPALGTAAVAVWSFTAALLANPITWIIIAIVALGAALYLLITHWDDVKKCVLKVWDAIVEATKVAVDWVADKFIWLWEKGIKPIFDSISGAAGFVWDAIKAAFNKVKDYVFGVFDAIWGKVKAIFGHSVNTVVGADMDKTVQVMNDAANKIMDILEAKIFDAVVAAFPKAFKAAFAKSGDAFTDFTKKQTLVFEKFLKKLITRFADAWTAIIDITATAMQQIEKTVGDVTQKLLTVQAAYSNLQMEKAKAEEARIAEKASEPKPKSAMAGSLTEKLIDATNAPDWYEKSYKNLFIAHTQTVGNQLQAIATVLSRGSTAGVSGAPTAAAAKKTIRASVNNFGLPEGGT